MNKKHILITGAAGNLGSAVAKKLMDEGHQVIGTLVPGDKKPEDGVDYYECNLMNADATSDLFTQLRKQYDNLDAAICLVGGFGMGNIREALSEDVMKMFQLNFMTAFHTTKHAVNWMNERKSGKLILVGAKPALEGGGAAIMPYAISKNAVIKLAEIINEDKENHVTASVIVPSVIDTPPNRKSMPDAQFSDWVTPEQIADNISFLISEKSNVLRDTVLKVYNNA